MPKSPVHAMSALLTLTLDLLWGGGEGVAALTGIGLLAVPVLMAITFFCTLIGTLLVQKFIAKDGFGISAAKAFVLAILAGVPFPVTGTAVGVLLISWSGLSLVGGRLLPSRS